MASFAIGDVHGMMAKLNALLERLPFSPASDRLVFLGDLVDRGPRSREVMEKVMALRECMGSRLVCLKGNHEDLLLRAVDRGKTSDLVTWLYNGGGATLKSYGVAAPDDIPSSHLDFCRSLPSYWEDERHIFVHGDVDPLLPLLETPDEVLLWGRGMHPHILSEKIVVCGHTPQANGILKREKVICIDTGACYTYPGMGLLTAIDLSTYEIWQA